MTTRERLERKAESAKAKAPKAPRMTDSNIPHLHAARDRVGWEADFDAYFIGALSVYVLPRTWDYCIAEALACCGKVKP